MTYYSITADEQAKEAATICPICGGKNTSQVFSAPHVRIKGGDWHDFHKKNAGAMTRERDLHSLKNGADPYAEHRTPTEKAEIIEKLEDAGKRKPKRTYFS